MYLVTIRPQSEAKLAAISVESQRSNSGARRTRKRWDVGNWCLELLHDCALPGTTTDDLEKGHLNLILGTRSSGVNSGECASGPWIEIDFDWASDRVRIVRAPAGLMTAFFARVKNGLAIGDSVPALLQCPGISRKVDFAALNEYWFLDFCIAPKTIWADIKAVPNGHSASILVGSHAEPSFERRYIPGENSVRSGPLRSEDAGSELRKIVLDATERSLAASSKAHVNLLSGGVDSSAVFAACNLIGRKPAYAVTFKGIGDADESVLASQTAGHFGVPIEVVSSESANLIHDAREIVQIWGQPYAHGSVHAMQAMLAQVSPEYMLLTGDGGGEAFAGSAERVGRLRHLASAVLGGYSALSQETQIRGYRRIATTFHYARALFFGLELGSARTEAEVLLRKVPLTTLESLAVIAPPFRSMISKKAVEDALLRLGTLSGFPGESLFARALYFYRAPEGVYAKTWRILDAKGMVGDAPLAAPEFTDAVKRIPVEERGQHKQALRDAFADVLPPEVVNAPKRGLRPLNRELLARSADEGVAWITNGESGAWDSLFDKEVVADFWRAHRDGRVFRSNLLYKAVIFRAWCDAWKPDLEGCSL